MIVVERTVGTWGVVKFKGEHKMSRFNIKFFGCTSDPPIMVGGAETVCWPSRGGGTCNLDQLIRLLLGGKWQLPYHAQVGRGRKVHCGEWEQIV